LVHHEKFTSRAESLRRERSLKRGRANQSLRRRFETEGL
jgi:predicted GIY-YIG superfamily endonuclease